MKFVYTLLAIACVILLSSSKTVAQDTPSDFGLVDGTLVFLDANSDSRCGTVNTFNADFIIRSCDRRLVLTTGDDREVPFTVDEDYNVTRDDGAPAGQIRFATDNDGNRQVFWLSDANFENGENLVLSYVPQSEALVVATVTGQEGQEVTLSPINISQTQCDPFATFDGNTEVLCPRSVCGSGLASLTLTFSCLLALRMFRVRNPK